MVKVNGTPINLETVIKRFQPEARARNSRFEPKFEPNEFKMKECYRRCNGSWEKWDEDNRVTYASEAQVLEALRNA